MDGLGIHAPPSGSATGSAPPSLAATASAAPVPSSASAAAAAAGSPTVATSAGAAAASSAPNGTAEAEQSQDLWSSILNSVKSKKAIITKNVILLGEPQTGKSTLLAALASNSPSGLISSSSGVAKTPLMTSGEEADASAAAAGAGPSSKDRAKDGRSVDLGLGYGYFEVADEKDRDEIVARVGVHTLHSSDPAYTSLLPFALPPPIGSATAEQASSQMATLTSSIVATGSSSSSAKANANGLFQPRASIEALQDSLILITLDWEQPWTFLDQLRNWLEILRELVDSASEGSLSKRPHETRKWSKAQVALDEMRERLESYIRHYVEPQPANAAAGVNGGVDDLGAGTILPPPSTLLSAALEEDDPSPLTDGMLTENWGVPIVVTCTKADLIPKLEREKDFKEEQFDYLQQVLRTVCMKYGAALFFTSHTRPQSFDILRSYLLHRLFTPHHSANAAALGSAQPGGNGNGDAPATGAATLGAAGGSTEFRFPYRAITTDRDTLLVPSGWDSWGKIRALRDGFDCKGMGRGWEYDCEFERLRRERKLPKGNKEIEDQLDKEIERDAEDRVRSAVKLYEDIIADYEAGPPPHILGSKVRQPDEQEFLGQHHAALQKDPDPRSKFAKQNAQIGGDGAVAGASGSGGEPLSPGTEAVDVGLAHKGVGPMAGSALSLPGIDRLLSERAASMDEGFSSSSSVAGAAGSAASSRPVRVPGPSRRDTTSARDGHGSSGAGTRKDAASLLAGITTSGRGVGDLSSSADLVSPTSGVGGAVGRTTGSSRPTSPAMGTGSTSPSLGDINDPNNPKQSEVLHTFFQSLLKEKGPSGTSMRMLGRDLRPSRSQRSGTSGHGTPSKGSGGVGERGAAD
ncbi:hypothetical protein ACQY0O_007490 [Thecaphora frezii]